MTESHQSPDAAAEYEVVAPQWRRGVRDLDGFVLWHVYHAGDRVTLDSDDAASLLASGTVRAVEPDATSKPPKKPHPVHPEHPGKPEHPEHPHKPDDELDAVLRPKRRRRGPATT